MFNESIDGELSANGFRMDHLLKNIADDMMKTKDVVAKMFKNRQGNASKNLKKTKIHSVLWELWKNPGVWEKNDYMCRKGWYTVINDLPNRRKYTNNRKDKEMKKWWNDPQNYQTDLANNNWLKWEMMVDARFTFRKYVPAIPLSQKCAHCGCRKSICPEETNCFYRFVNVGDKRVQFDYNCGRRCNKRDCSFGYNEWNHLGLKPIDYWTYCIAPGFEYFNNLTLYWQDIIDEILEMLQDEKRVRDQQLSGFGLTRKTADIQNLCDIIRNKVELQGTSENKIYKNIEELQNDLYGMQEQFDEMKRIIGNQTNFLAEINDERARITEEINLIEREYIVFYSSERFAFLGWLHSALSMVKDHLWQNLSGWGHAKAKKRNAVHQRHAVVE